MRPQRQFSESFGSAFVKLYEPVLGGSSMLGTALAYDGARQSIELRDLHLSANNFLSKIDGGELVERQWVRSPPRLGKWQQYE